MANIKRFTKGVEGLQLYLLGMKMALESGSFVQSSDMVKHVLKDSLHQLTDWNSLALNLAKSQCKYKLPYVSSQNIVVVEEGRELALSFDESLNIFRQKISFFQEDDCSMDELLEDEVSKNSDLVNMISSGEMCTSINGCFRSQITSMAFLYNMRLFISEMISFLEDIFCQQKDVVEISSTQLAVEAVVVASDTPVYDSSAINYALRPDARAPGLQNIITDSCGYCSHRQPIISSAKPINYAVVRVVIRRLLSCLRPIDFHKFTISLKVALAMALAGFIGLEYNPFHAHWAGIIIAMGVGNYKTGSFKLINLRLQGTVCGSIYGYLINLITRQAPMISLAAMIPWVVITSFLRNSKMYEYSGSMSATVAAVILLGRKHQVPLELFSMVRITQAFLGMLCFVVVEMLLWPRRAGVLLQQEMVETLDHLQECVKRVFSINRGHYCQNCWIKVVEDLKEKAMLLQGRISYQNALIDEAKTEPRFWYASPFHSSIYCKVTDIQVRIVNLLLLLISCSLESKISDDPGDKVAIMSFIQLLKLPVKFLEDDFMSTFENLRKVLKGNHMKQNYAHSSNDLKQQSKKQYHMKDPESQLIVGWKGLGARLGKFLSWISAYFPNQRIKSMANHASHNMDLHTSSKRHFDLHTLIEVFEESYAQMTKRLIITTESASTKPASAHKLSNSVMLSFSALTFCLHGLLKETLELEKAIAHLLQIEETCFLVVF